MPVRKYTAFFLAILISLVSLFGCSSGNSDVSSAGEAAPPASSDSPAAASSGAAQAVSAQKDNLTVTITLSKDFMNTINSMTSSASSSSPSSSQPAEGVISDTKNPDGSETIVMTREAYDKSMTNMKQSIKDSLEKIKSGSTSLKNISANDDMTEFRVEVDKEKFSSSFDGFALVGLYFSGGMYQMFSGVETPRTVFHLIDASNGQEYSTVTYPDAFHSASSK